MRGYDRQQLDNLAEREAGKLNALDVVIANNQRSAAIAVNQLINDLDHEPAWHASAAPLTGSEQSALESRVKEWLTTNLFYIRVRLLDKTGEELLEVVRTPAGVVATPRTELSAALSDPAMRQALRRRPGETYIGRS